MKICGVFVCMGARWLPALGLTFEHVRCLRAIACGQPLPGSGEVAELVECGFAEVDHDQLVLTATGRRYLRLSSIDAGRGRRSGRRSGSAHGDPAERINAAETHGLMSSSNRTES